MSDGVGGRLHGSGAVLALGSNPAVATGVLWSLGAVAGLLSLAHAFVPLDEFVHRTDDAFYYFKVAFNYPETGFWSFDGLHSTNGVQPLWAWIITALAELMTRVGLRDADLFARSVVAVTALCHVASVLLLYRVLTRLVSAAAAVSAAVALLLPLGVVWRHVWGMENSLYALLLMATLSSYLFRFRATPSNRHAVVLGLWLGVTALARLNAALLAVCTVAAIVIERRGLPLGRRLRLGVIVAVVSASFVVPYLAWNYVTTGNPLPISGAVKSVQTAAFMGAHGVDSPLSRDFVAVVLEEFGNPLRQFVTWRVADGLTLVGGRLLLGEEGDWRFAPLLAVVVALPLLFGWRQWIASVLDAARRLAALWFVAAFAVLNAAISVFSYPQQIHNAMTKWWLVESEVLIAIVAGTTVGLAVATVGSRLIPGRHHAIAATVALAMLVGAHATRAIRTYADGRFDMAEWNLSWNDESLRAARWLAANVPDTAVVGSWNAGVLGYYAEQRVTNLDGLINNFDLLPHLRQGTLGTYVLDEGIAYLADVEGIFSTYRMPDQLSLREVYRRRNALLRQDYVIYEVLGPALRDADVLPAGR